MLRGSVGCAWPVAVAVHVATVGAAAATIVYACVEAFTVSRGIRSLLRSSVAAAWGAERSLQAARFDDSQSAQLRASRHWRCSQGHTLL